MTLELFGAILGIAVFIMILAFRLPNWLTYVAVAPIVWQLRWRQQVLI